MLTYLSVHNLAIIDKLELELESGLTVVTGETGAGKSMLLSAVTLLLGARLSQEMLRTGEETLSLESVWTTGGRAAQLAEILGEDVADELQIRRTARFSETGKRDRIHVDGQLSTQTTTGRLAEVLINIASQHEYISLLKKAQHIHILDSFAGHDKLLTEMQAEWDRYDDLSRRVEDLRHRCAQRDARIRELRGVVDNLEALELKAQEEDEILAAIGRLTHGAEIGQALEAGVQALYEDDRAVVSSLALVEKHLAAASRFEPQLEPVLERIAEVLAEVEDITGVLRDIAGKVDADPAYLDHLQERLARIQKLKRKHRVEHSDDLLALLARSALELEELGGMDLELNRLEKEFGAAATSMARCGARLSESRGQAAQRLSKRIARTLSSLEMKNASLEVSLEHDPARAGPLGADHVEFLFSANPGETVKPLQKIASGGELSRVLLAFKAVLADAYPVPTYIFDEIDSGIGGKTALSAGKLLADLAAKHQVICITHTAQLAAYADHHLVVGKTESGGKTRAWLKQLDSPEDRIAELARMLSGLEDSQTALSHARELLEAAQSQRRKLL